jgi:hypothetical protein
VLDQSAKILFEDQPMSFLLSLQIICVHPVAKLSHRINHLSENGTKHPYLLSRVAALSFGYLSRS